MTALQKGPLSVAFTVYADFPTYKSGVYKHVSGAALGGHAVEVIGYGTDATIWGGELLMICDPAGFTRVGHLAPFSLPGGEGAVRQPARIALDLLRRAGIAFDD